MANEFDPQKMTEYTERLLIEGGAPPADARRQATELMNKIGIVKIGKGECPRHAFSPLACTFCLNGHMLDCHYPYTCEEANCSHHQATMREDFNDQP